MAMTRKVRQPDLGRRFAAARSDRGLSQASVARISGIAPSYLSRIETGRVHPTLGTAARIAGALRISLDDLTGYVRGSDHRGACPVSRSGECLMDHPRVRPTASPAPGDEVYSAAQLRVLRRFNEVLQAGSPEVIKALEILLARISETISRRP